MPAWRYTDGSDEDEADDAHDGGGSSDEAGDNEDIWMMAGDERW